MIRQLFHDIYDRVICFILVKNVIVLFDLKEVAAGEGVQHHVLSIVVFERLLLYVTERDQRHSFFRQDDKVILIIRVVQETEHLGLPKGEAFMPITDPFVLHIDHHHCEYIDIDRLETNDQLPVSKVTLQKVDVGITDLQSSLVVENQLSIKLILMWMRLGLGSHNRIIHLDLDDVDAEFALELIEHDVEVILVTDDAADLTEVELLVHVNLFVETILLVIPLDLRVDVDHVELGRRYKYCLLLIYLEEVGLAFKRVLKGVDHRDETA